jgi:hypothetical protein
MGDYGVFLAGFYRYLGLIRALVSPCKSVSLGTHFSRVSEPRVYLKVRVTIQQIARGGTAFVTHTKTQGPSDLPSLARGETVGMTIFIF